MIILFVSVTLSFLWGTTTFAEGSFVLKRIKERGTINMGHRESSVPFAYIGSDGKPIGYTIDLCMKVIDAVKRSTMYQSLHRLELPLWRMEQ